MFPLPLPLPLPLRFLVFEDELLLRFLLFLRLPLLARCPFERLLVSLEGGSCEGGTGIQLIKGLGSMSGSRKLRL
jgi:hypothetical protein